MGKGLTKRIDELINECKGGATPVDSGYVKSRLIDIRIQAEALENRADIRDAESKIEVLEAALEKSNAENGNLKVEMQELETELETFRAERKRKEEEEKKADLPDVQVRILESLPSEHLGGGLGLIDIANAGHVPADEAEIHITNLEGLRYAGHRTDFRRDNETIWYRSSEGTKLIVAMRKAGEGEKRKPIRKHLDLTQVEELVLILLNDFRKQSARTSQIRGRLEPAQT